MSETHPLRLSVSLVSQGKHRFYTLTMPSDLLAKTTFVTTRDEDPQQGFQRVLDKKRALEIAQYIDSGLGTIPNSIVLSAQPDAQLRIIGKGKTIEFNPTRKAFLVLDGQHRVYGFSLAKTNLRVPVVIYNNLTRTEEAKLFIDINTKQRPVPNELLLDIKKLAEYDSESERLFGTIFDKFNSDTGSPLLGKMSPTERSRGKISRVTFNAAMKPLFDVFGGTESNQVYSILKEYLTAIQRRCEERNVREVLTNPVVFRGFLLLFPEIAERVRDRFSGDYSTANFDSVIEPIFTRIKKSALERPGASIIAFKDALSQSLRQSFSL